MLLCEELQGGGGGEILFIEVNCLACTYTFHFSYSEVTLINF